jgi:hypothetical protein
MKTISWICLLFLCCTNVFAQIDDYSFKRELKGITNLWHTVELPNAVLDKVSEDLSDIRLYGITPENDTVEAPYLIDIKKEHIENKRVDYELLNVSHNANGYYFTFKIPSKNANEILFDFGQHNFDWRISLEGSQDQLSWFKMIENYRILSIQNQFSNYQFTKVSFPNSAYRYIRVCVKSREKPNLLSANVYLKERTGGKTRDYKIVKQTISELKDEKQTVIDLDLEYNVPISSVQLWAADEFDYYRNVTIQYLSDSTKTKHGYIYHYQNTGSGVLSSIDPHGFSLNNTQAKKLKIIIENNDNQALNIEKIKIQGNVHTLVARFTEPGSFFMVYGKDNTPHPHYDINHFASNIPDVLTSLTLGNEERMTEEVNSSKTNAPIVNKGWLWAIILVIIAVLGGFTLKMLKNK